MRPLLVLLHRWFGLAAAVFLCIAGLTGAVIAFDHELDAALNPQFFHARAAGPAQRALLRADRLEATEPARRVRYLPLPFPLQFPLHFPLHAGRTPAASPASLAVCSSGCARPVTATTPPGPRFPLPSNL